MIKITTKSTHTPLNVHKNSSIVAILTQMARELVKKSPGMYIGNLKYWLLERNPDATKIEVELAFNQLIRQGYFLSYEETIYPPNTVDEQIKQITKYASKFKLSLTDYGILYEVHRQNGINSRQLVSRGWGEDEREVKMRISELFQKKIILKNQGNTIINRKLILEAIR